MASAFALTVGAQGNYTVSGSLKNAEGKKAYLFVGSGENTTSDSTTVQNGTFSFSGTMDCPFSAARVVVGSLTDYNNACIWELALQPTSFSIAADCSNPGDATVKGGVVQDELNAMNEELNVFVLPLRKLGEEMSGGASRDSIQKLMEPYQKMYAEYSENFYKQRTKSFYATRYLMMHMSRMSYDELKAAWDALDPKVQKYGDSAGEIAKELAVLAKVRPGSPAPDFTATDINGKQFTMSSLRGKVVIIDFWASWCGPCRKSNPHMRELYAKFHDRGLDFVFVSDDDTNPDKWRKAVEQDQLIGDGYHHVLRGMKFDRSKGVRGIDHTNDISAKYAIHFLPTKYLIDRNGNIVCKIGEESEEQLNAEIERLLAQ